MSRNSQKLTLDGIAELACRLSNDFVKCSADKSISIPNKLIYRIVHKEEDAAIERSARFAAFKQINDSSPIRKYAFSRYSGGAVVQEKRAFDTRRIDQELTRNPRANLQYWNRSQQFVDELDADKLDTFAKLLTPLNEIKKQYGSEPEYFESYARILNGLVNRVCQIDSQNVEVFKPQLAYLEQLLFARYRLTLPDIKKMGGQTLKARIMQKDEKLLRRGDYQDITGSGGLESKAVVALKDGNERAGNDLIKTLFETHRKQGEKTVERTITITIKDSVLDEVAG